MASRWFARIRYAARLLWRTPAFTLTAVASIAIGVGANTTIFTAANAILLAPTRGVRAPDRLVDIGASRNGEGFDTLSYPTYLDIRDQARTLDGIYAVGIVPRAMSLGTAGGAERVYGQLVSASYFDVLGVRPAAGAVFRAAEEQPGVPLRKIVLSDRFWRQRFASDPGVVGREVVLNGDTFVVSGVAPRGFQGTTILSPDVWVPLSAGGKATDAIIRGRGNLWLVVGARLRDDATIEQTRAELTRIGTGQAAQYPADYKGLALVAAPGSRIPGDAQAIVPVIAVLGTLVGLVLLIACANLASLLLARAAARARETAVRLALGATRFDLIAQMLTESVLVFVVGGAAGVLLALWMSAALWALLPALPIPIDIVLSPDWRVVAFTASLSLVTGLLTGLAPALQSSRADLVAAMKSDESTRARQRLRHAFVAAQMGLCLLLIVMAGLFLRALGKASSADPGFQVSGIDVAGVDLSLGGYSRTQSADVTEQIRSRLAAIPGVSAVGAAAVVPLAGDGLGLGDLRVPGMMSAGAGLNADWNVISPEFLPLLRIPLVRGRNFTAADGGKAPLVAIVNERLARAAWPGVDPIGRTLEAGDFRPGHEADRRILTIVGVARDAKYRWVGDRPRQFLYVPIAQETWQRVQFFIRRDLRLAASTSLAPATRAALREVSPNLPLITLTPFQTIADLGLLPQRLAASVAGSLGTVALILAAIGIYGVTTYAVARRTREIGIRMALGASSATIMRMVLGQGLWLTIAGGSAGLLLAVAVAFVLASQNMLFGITTIDPVSFGGAAAMLVGIALLASYVPARRAARADPLSALRVL